MKTDENSKNTAITFSNKSSDSLTKTPEEMRNLSKAINNIYKEEKFHLEQLQYDIDQFCENSDVAYEIKEDIDMLIWDILDQGDEIYEEQKILDGGRGLVSSLLSHPVYIRHLENYINQDCQISQTELEIQMVEITRMNASGDADELYSRYMVRLEDTNTKHLEKKISSKDEQLVREYIESEIRGTVYRLERIKSFANNSLIYNQAEMCIENDELISILRKRVYNDDGSVNSQKFSEILDYLKECAEEEKHIMELNEKGGNESCITKKLMDFM